MKILVAVKRVIDHNVRIRVRADGTGVETANIRFSMNPFDRHAVEAAVTFGGGNEVVAVSIGPKAATEVLLNALAMGADRAVLVETEARLETLAIAKLLAALVREESPDLVMLGKQAVDDDSNHVGQMLAGLLGWPQATFASEIAAKDNRIEVTREVDFGRVTFALPLPAVVTADLRLNTPRTVGLPMVMKARQKPFATRQAEDFGVDLAPRLRIEAVRPPHERDGGRSLGSVAELAGVIEAELAAGKVVP